MRRFIRSLSTLLVLILPVLPLLLLHLSASKEVAGYKVAESSGGGSSSSSSSEDTYTDYSDETTAQEDIRVDKLRDRHSLIEWLPSGQTIHQGPGSSQDITLGEVSSEESRLRDLCSRRLPQCSPGSSSNLYAHLKPTTSRGPQGEVCGSDGRLYSSWCQLKWEACLQPTRHLFRQSQSYCNSTEGAIAALPHDNHVRLTSNAPLNMDKELLPAWMLPHRQEQHQQETRFIQLKGGCDRAQYERMKWILWQSFNSSSQALFTHLDANQNSLIEAHELWPRASGHQVYVQLRDDADAERCVRGEPEAGQLESSTCWTRLDLPFEPQYPPNPCSLSHLMLYELAEGFSNFTGPSFDRVFHRMQSQSSNPKSVMKMTSSVAVRIGHSATLKCSPPSSWWAHVSGWLKDNGIASDDYEEDLERLEERGAGDDARVGCTWSRLGSDLASNQGPHLSIVSEARDTQRHAGIHNHDEEEERRGLVLEVSDAQLYLSGQYKCTCRQLMDSGAPDTGGLFEHLFNLQVSVEPVVRVIPQWQWSLPSSRASFECHYDYIDTAKPSTSPRQISSATATSSLSQANSDEAVADDQEGQFGLRVGWFREGPKSDANHSQLDTPIKGSSVSLAASKLTLENLSLFDSGRYACRVERLDKGNNGSGDGNRLSGFQEATLLVRDRPLKTQLVQSDTTAAAATTTTTSNDDANQQQATHLWMFHEAGISIYRLHTDNGGQEIELVREINGHSPVDARVDGNWNQLTLCGGLNLEQVVICEWSDNAIHIDVPLNVEEAESDEQVATTTTSHKYIYVGQPNLNRILVMDGVKIEIVAIVNTQPQPRKLYLYTPSKIHLSKWLRKRLVNPKKHAHHHHQHHQHKYHSASVSASASAAHSFPSTNSRLFGTRDARDAPPQARHLEPEQASKRKRPTLIQHDIWLLCYGQPLIVDPSGDEHLNEDPDLLHQPTPSRGGPIGELSASKLPISQANSAYKRSTNPNVINTIQPFTPRLYFGGLPLAGQFASPVWPYGGNKDSQLLMRNRKSVHIIQSTFFPSQLKSSNHEQQQPPSNHSILDDFKKSSVFTKHHIHHHHKTPPQQSLKYLSSRPQLDLIRDLYVQQKLPWLANNPNYKLHYAYVTHYNSRRLFRVSMDKYRYDSEIDLEHCDPINLIATAQGLLVLQCRSPVPSSIGAPLVGQLVLDQLTNAKVQFNPNVQAQESYLTPDNRYLISIFTNSTGTSPFNDVSSTTKNRRATSQAQDQPPSMGTLRRQSIIFVQSVSVDGLKLEYEIKTSSLEITECSFVWKEGYYVAILVSTNRRDHQSEILSLRLADGRLELTARVPGSIESHSSLHKSQLVVASRLQMAVVSTNQGIYVVDLVDNRVVQSLKHHQSPPTLLWV